MPEYLCIINSKKPERLPSGFTELSSTDYNIGIRGRYKFEQDCILQEDQKILVLLIGVVFNKLKLISESKKESWFDTISDLYNKNGDVFFKYLKGSYNGIIYDKLKSKWLAFSNIQHERPVFYSIIDKEIIIASNINLINEIHQKRHRKLTLNTDGAYMMLSYGFMLGNFTLYNEIKRLKVGYYLEYNDEIIKETEYYRFSNKEFSSISSEDVIENVDFLFKEAVKIQFEKDNEYGFEHIASLSGGLDSRMTVFCAHELGFINQLNITFSQSGYLEQTIACSIASKLKHEWIFKSLDNGLFLYDLDRITRITGGNILYYAIAMEHRMLSMLNIERYGLLHTGQIGGLFYFYPKHRRPSITDGAHSHKMLNRISRESLNFEEYENEEIFLIHNRYLNGTNYGLAGILDFTETFSPHYDMECWEYCLKVPLDLRYKHKVYKQWIIKKYPLAADFIWEKSGVKIYDNLLNKIKIYHDGRAIKVQDLFTGFYRRMARHFNFNYKPSLWGMNPFNSWLQINTDLNVFINKYFNDKIVLLDSFPELKVDCHYLFTNGNGLEKIQVLSLLSAIQTFC